METINETTTSTTSIDIISTLVPSKFNDLAVREGMTPEVLAALVLTNCTDDFIHELRRGASIKADLNGQDCADCRLKDNCKSAFKRQSLICFEALMVVAAAALAWMAVHPAPPRRRREELSIAQPPSLYEPPLLPDFPPRYMALASKTAPASRKTQYY